MSDEFKPKKASWREYDRQFVTMLQSRPQDERSALAVRALLGGLEVSENRRSLPKTYFPSPKSDAEREGRIALAAQLRNGAVHPSTLKLLADLIDPDAPHSNVPRTIRFDFRKSGVGRGGLVDTPASDFITETITQEFMEQGGFNRSRAEERMGALLNAEPAQVGRINRRARKIKLT